MINKKTKGENKKMINKKTKSFGVVLLSILMLFSLVLFTACQPLGPGDPPKFYTNADAKTVISNATYMLENAQTAQTVANSNQDANNAELLAGSTHNTVTATVEVGTNAMTEYKGIKGWELNSVDFAEVSSNQVSNISAGFIRGFKFFTYLLDQNMVSINEDYALFRDESNNADMRIKIEIADNEMILYHYSYNQSYGGISRYFITFDDELEIKNIIGEQFNGDSANTQQNIRVHYYANNSVYAIEKSYTSQTIPTLHNGYIQSIKAESTKPTKQMTAITINLQQIMNSFN